TKLIRGLTSEAPAGFQSRRGLSYDDSAPVSPHNAPFPTYKAPRVHRAHGRSVIVRIAIRGIGPSADHAPADHLYRGKRAQAFRKGHWRLHRMNARARLHRGPRLRNGISVGRRLPGAFACAR